MPDLWAGTGALSEKGMQRPTVPRDGRAKTVTTLDPGKVHQAGAWHNTGGDHGC